MKELNSLLSEKGQTHILQGFDDLSAEEQARFIAEIENIDWATVALWKQPEDLSGKGKIEPIEGLSLGEIERRREEFFALGAEAIRKGKVACVLLAGGQGTRLGSDAPKGMYDVGVTHPLYIFEMQIRNLLSVCKACGASVPLFIMTSDKNDAATKAFFKAHSYFGYPEEFVRFFRQEMAPSVDFGGKLLLEDRGKLALSPNGNGGWYSSLKRAGADGDFPAIEWYNVYGVDNVLQKSADPVFIGATIASGMNSGAKVVRKTEPHEKVGVLCLEDGKPSVIEYYEMTEERASERGADGNLAYSFGVILNYLLSARRLEEIARERIPVHVVKKKIPHLAEDGTFVRPDRENGYKFETLILDMIRLMGSCLPFEVVREREFAPIKNKEGVDSVESARKLLQENGVTL